MIYFLLPKTHPSTVFHLQCTLSPEQPTPYLSCSLSYYLTDIKERINGYLKEWDIYKKYTNPFEYIHSNLPNKKKCIAKHKPLSRSYFKMIEMVHIFQLFYIPKQQLDCTTIVNIPLQGISYSYGTNHKTCIPNLNNYTMPITSFHLAEGPGGFIEALVELRKNPNDMYYGMTILDVQNDSNIPAWKKSQTFLKDHPNVYIEAGVDNTGNLLNIDNLQYCTEKYGSTMDFITADGGFDFSIDFNQQEISITRLLFAQIAFALCMQKKNGTFILKIFDAFMQQTIDLLYLLSSFYEKVYITKPQTSRIANSEKYIICKHFIPSCSEEFYPYIYNTFRQMMSLPHLYVHRFLKDPLPYFFVTKIEEYNSIFGQQQIENIHNTIALIETKNKNEKINMMLRANIQKCMNWCTHHQIQYNPIN